MRRVIWSAEADADLKQVESWLAANRPPSFELRMLAAIHDRCAFLLKFPDGGPMAKGELRKLLVLRTPYILIYRIDGSGIEIIRLFHERQDWLAML